MSPPKTLHLTNAFHATSGGIRAFYRALLAAADDRQRPMCLAVPAERSDQERLGRFAVVYHLAARRAPLFDRRYRLLTPAHYLSRRSMVARLLRRELPDIVEVCDKYTLVPVARLLRTGWYGPWVAPTVVGLSCERMDDNVRAYVSGSSPALAVAGRYLRCIYVPAFHAHIANSQYTAEELQTLGGAADVTVCPMGVDAALFAQTPRDEALRAAMLSTAGGTSSSVLVFYAGRLAPEKNLALLVDAIGKLSRARRHDGTPFDPRLVLAGDGPQLVPLAARAARVAPGRVAFLGHIADRRRLAAHYASADVFAHPNFREPFGIGPLEAMAAGIPVVVPASGGVTSYANAANAWLAAPDVTSFAAAIADASTGLGTARVERAADTARAHAWERVTSRYFDLLDGLHEGRLAAAVRPSAMPRVGTAAGRP